MRRKANQRMKQTRADRREGLGTGIWSLDLRPVPRQTVTEVEAEVRAGIGVRAEARLVSVRRRRTKLGSRRTGEERSVYPLRRFASRSWTRTSRMKEKPWDRDCLWSTRTKWVAHSESLFFSGSSLE